MEKQKSYRSVQKCGLAIQVTFMRSVFYWHGSQLETVPFLIQHWEMGMFEVFNVWGNGKGCVY